MFVRSLPGATAAVIVSLAGLMGVGAAPAHAQFGFDFSIGRDTFFTIGTPPLVFPMGGDTFGDPFILRNTSTSDVQIVGFSLNLAPVGLFFDTIGQDSKDFTPDQGTDVPTGLDSSSVADGGQSLSLSFLDFDPDEVFRFVIDVDDSSIDPVGSGDETIEGGALVGALVEVDFSNGQSLGGTLTGFSGDMATQAAEASASAGGETVIPTPGAAAAGLALLATLAARRRRSA